MSICLFPSAILPAVARAVADGFSALYGCAADTGDAVYVVPAVAGDLHISATMWPDFMTEHGVGVRCLLDIAPHHPGQMGLEVVADMVPPWFTIDRAPVRELRVSLPLAHRRTGASPPPVLLLGPSVGMTLSAIGDLSTTPDPLTQSPFCLPHRSTMAGHIIRAYLRSLRDGAWSTRMARLNAAITLSVLHGVDDV